TQRCLREALYELIIERGWEQVSVQDICERADVGRSTFYVHFADKEDLLLSGFQRLEQELRARAAGRGDALAFVEPLLVHVREHHRLARALTGNRSAQQVQRRLHEVIAAVLSEAVSSEAVSSGAVSSGAAVHAEPRRDAAVQYLTGALLAAIIWWLEAPRLTPQEFEQWLRELSAP